MVPGLESVVKDVVSNMPTQHDALRLVEGPVNAQIDSALAVLFLRLGEG